MLMFNVNVSLGKVRVRVAQETPEGLATFEVTTDSKKINLKNSRIIIQDSYCKRLL